MAKKKDQVEIKYWKTSDLIGAEYNPRQITEKQFTELQDSIKRFGFKDPIIVNVSQDRHGIIVAGHQRKRVAESLDMETIPVVEVSLTLEQEREFNIRHNKSGGSFDMDALANYFEVDELKEWGFEAWEVGMQEFDEPLEIDGDLDVEEDEIKPPSTRDDDYSTFELVMLHDNKLKLLDVLSGIKEKNSLETQEEALMELILNYTK